MRTNSIMPNEQVVISLQRLYDHYGYCRYKMNKFEEYDLYARNKDFLISENVLTFTDMNGRLMALKPDVTLSIVKDTRAYPQSIQKLYYHENVYRVSKGNHAFREIPQIGLEAIGDVDAYCVYEVLKLAAESLLRCGRNCVLEISHLGVLSELFRYAGIPESENNKVLHWIGEKNPHELVQALQQYGVSAENQELLLKTLAINGNPDDVLPRICDLLNGIVSDSAMGSFTEIIQALNVDERKEILRIDFSVTSNLRYYNGFVFRGFAEGIPSSILSGGQYDRMMQKMKKNCKAIGFAVYLDLLEQYSTFTQDYDVDILLLYQDGISLETIENAAKALGRDGKSILVQRRMPNNIRSRQILKVTESGVVTIG